MKQLTKFLTIVLLFVQVSCAAQKTKQVNSSFDPTARPRNLSDSALLDIVQKQTFRYFWDFAHPVSGLARERSNENFGYGHEVVTTGGVAGTGFIGTGFCSFVQDCNK